MKKGQKIFLILIAIVAVIPVLIVLLLYRKYGFCKIEEIWYEDSLIDYWGVIIGAAPAVVFAALTYRQTEKIYRLQDSWTRENTKRPFFIIDQITANEDEALKCNGNCYEGSFFDDELPKGRCVTVILRNIGEGVAVRFLNMDETFGDAVPTKKFVQPDKTVRVRIPLFTSEAMQRDGYENKTVALLYQNIVGVQYRQEIKFEESYQPENQERERDIYTLKIHDISEQTIPESDIPDNEKNTKNKERRKEYEDQNEK